MRKISNPGEYVPKEKYEYRGLVVRGMLSFRFVAETVVRTRGCAEFSSNGQDEIQDNQLRLGCKDYSLALLHASLASDF